MTTFEEVAKHVSGLKAVAVPKDKAAAQASLCAIYAGVRPILSFIVNIPFLPQTWRNLLGGLITTVDLICQGQP